MYGSWWSLENKCQIADKIWGIYKEMLYLNE